MINKKGISEVIATVLIVMLTVGAASILFVFVIPWVTTMLDDSKICNDLQDSISIVGGAYTCYVSVPAPVSTRVMIRINEGKDAEVAGFAVSLASSGSAKRYEIKNGEESSSGSVVVSMLDGNEMLTVPEVGGAETYVFTGVKAESVDVSPLTVNGKTCNPTTQKLVDCSLA